MECLYTESEMPIEGSVKYFILKSFRLYHVQRQGAFWRAERRRGYLGQRIRKGQKTDQGANDKATGSGFTQTRLPVHVLGVTSACPIFITATSECEVLLFQKQKKFLSLILICKA